MMSASKVVLVRTSVVPFPGVHKFRLPKVGKLKELLGLEPTGLCVPLASAVYRLLALLSAFCPVRRRPSTKLSDSFESRKPLRRLLFGCVHPSRLQN